MLGLKMYLTGKYADLQQRENIDNTIINDDVKAVSFSVTTTVSYFLVQ